MNNKFLRWLDSVINTLAKNYTLWIVGAHEARGFRDVRQRVSGFTQVVGGRLEAE